MYMHKSQCLSGGIPAVRLTITRRHFIEKAERIEVVFGVETTVDLYGTFVLRKLVNSKNNGK